MWRLIGLESRTAAMFDATHWYLPWSWRTSFDILRWPLYVIETRLGEAVKSMNMPSFFQRTTGSGTPSGGSQVISRPEPRTPCVLGDGKARKSSDMSGKQKGRGLKNMLACLYSFQYKETPCFAPVTCFAPSSRVQPISADSDIFFFAGRSFHEMEDPRKGTQGHMLLLMPSFSC